MEQGYAPNATGFRQLVNRAASVGAVAGAASLDRCAVQHAGAVTKDHARPRLRAVTGAAGETVQDCFGPGAAARWGRERVDGSLAMRSSQDGGAVEDAVRVDDKGGVRVRSIVAAGEIVQHRLRPRGSGLQLVNRTATVRAAVVSSAV